MERGEEMTAERLAELRATGLPPSNEVLWAGGSPSKLTLLSDGDNSIQLVSFARNQWMPHLLPPDLEELVVAFADSISEAKEARTEIAAVLAELDATAEMADNPGLYGGMRERLRALVGEGE